MKSSRFKPAFLVLVLCGASLLGGCAMITEMANTPAEPSDYSSSTGTGAARDPYYRGHSNDASAAGIR